MNLTPEKLQVFLSHSGRDAHRATQLAATLEQRLAELGYQLEVFNTSEPEHRYKDLQELLTAGEDWRARAEQYEEELLAYLSENLQKSVAFLSLVTPNSLAAMTNVIEFEVEAAHSVATKNKTPFFFPCVADGASLLDLPRGAMEFQGIELDKAEGLTLLIEAVRGGLLEHAGR